MSAPGLEPGRARLVAALRPRATRRQALAALLLGLFGFGLVVQVRATQDAGLSALRQSDLVRILDDVTARSQRLQDESRDLERTRDKLTNSSDGRRAALEEAQRRAETLGILAGTVAALGPGVELSIPDPRGEVTPEMILDAVEELRDAGAEAIQVGRVRVVADTAFTAAPGGIAVDGTVVRPPYRVFAIGTSAALATALRIPGGLVEVLAEKGSTASVTERATVTVDALQALATPQYARPAPAETAG